jgi:hypothetical protein
MTQEGFSFSFDESACATCKGNCCSGEPGYIWVTSAEAAAIAQRLGMESEAFRAHYLIKAGYKFSIGERKNGESCECLFFDAVVSGCSIYDVRPSQCRTFPFWDYFLENPKEAGKECPGIVYHS